MESTPIITLEDVQKALITLQSIGVATSNLCYSDTDSHWDPILPFCDQPEDDIATGYLRGSSSHTRSLLPLLKENHFASAHEAEKFYLFNIAGAIFCVFGVALIAGLFLGLLTMDILQLRIIIRASLDEDEKLYASTILPIVEDRHLLLVTLLLMNALFYETLPLFLDNLVPSWCAILLSTTLIMFFGEILPSGVFMGPNQMYLGYRLAGLTRVFMVMMYPFAKPLALVLDYLVEGGVEQVEGGDESAYNRGELSALVRIQYEDSRAGVGQPKLTRGANIHKRPKRRLDFWHHTKQEILEKAIEIQYPDGEGKQDEQQPDPGEMLAPPLHQTEVDLIEGALQMKTVHVMDVYTPFSSVFSVPDDLVLDQKGFAEIYRQGYSRVPVYRASESPKDEEETQILGFLMVRQLILVDWEHKRDVSTLPLQRPRCISPRTNLVDGLRILRSHGYLMAFVCARPDLGNKALEAELPIPIEAGFMGVVTLEDIMESLLQETIYDEWDIRDRDRAVYTLQKWAATKLQEFVRKRKKAKALKEEALRSVGGSQKDHSMRDESKTEHSMRDESKKDESAPLLGKKSRKQNGTYSAV